MGIRQTYLFALVFFLLYACGENNNEDSLSSTHPFYSSLFSWQKINEQGWKNVSFPQWFNSERINNDSISQLKIAYTNFVVTDSNYVTDTFPHRSLLVSFNNKGKVEKLTITEYSLGQEIATSTFNYPYPADTFGYSSPIITSQTLFKEDGVFPFLNTLQEVKNYKRLVKKEYTDSLLHYYDEGNFIHHYFILDSTYWNVSFIDNYIHPKEKDKCYYGRPDNFLNSFSIRDLVKKTNYQMTDYYPNNVVKSQRYYSGDFYTKRHFNYDSIGRCIGFIDSLMTISEKFIHVEEGIIKYTSNLPRKILFFNAEDKNKSNPIQSIEISYQYREN